MSATLCKPIINCKNDDNTEFPNQRNHSIIRPLKPSINKNNGYDINISSVSTRLTPSTPLTSTITSTITSNTVVPLQRPYTENITNSIHRVYKQKDITKIHHVYSHGIIPYRLAYNNNNDISTSSTWRVRNHVHNNVHSTTPNISNNSNNSHNNANHTPIMPNINTHTTANKIGVSSKLSSRLSIEFLLVKPRDNDKWSFPKGLIDINEPYRGRETALRELKEETGIDILGNNVHADLCDYIDWNNPWQFNSNTLLDYNQHKFMNDHIKNDRDKNHRSICNKYITLFLARFNNINNADEGKSDEYNINSHELQIPDVSKHEISRAVWLDYNYIIYQYNNGCMDLDDGVIDILKRVESMLEQEDNSKWGCTRGQKYVNLPDVNGRCVDNRKTIIELVRSKRRWNLKPRETCTQELMESNWRCNNRCDQSNQFNLSNSLNRRNNNRFSRQNLHGSISWRK